MPNSQQTVQSFSIKAAGTIAAKRGVAIDGTQAADGVASAGVVIIGFADHAAVVGDMVRINRSPTSMAETGAACDGTENRLKTDTLGRVIPWTSGSIVAARLRPGETAAAAGQLIEVIPVYS